MIETNVTNIDNKKIRDEVNRDEIRHNKKRKTTETKIKREEKNQGISHFNLLTKLCKKEKIHPKMSIF